MTQFFKNTATAETQSFFKKKMIVLMNIERFIYKNNKQITDNQTNAVIKHTEVDMMTLRIIIENMDNTMFCYKLSQQQIADKIGKTRQHVNQALDRLERAGIIYKTQRYRYKKSTNTYFDATATNNAKTVICDKALRTKCGYHLTPNLISRIIDALKKGINKLSKIDLLQKVKTIVFTKTKIIKHFFSGRRETENLKVSDAIAQKNQQQQQQQKQELQIKKDTIKQNMQTEAVKNPTGISAHLQSLYDAWQRKNQNPNQPPNNAKGTYA